MPWSEDFLKLTTQILLEFVESTNLRTIPFKDTSQTDETDQCFQGAVDASFEIFKIMDSSNGSN